VNGLALLSAHQHGHQWQFPHNAESIILSAMKVNALREKWGHLSGTLSDDARADNQVDAVVFERVP